MMARQSKAWIDADGPLFDLIRRDRPGRVERFTFRLVLRNNEPGPLIPPTHPENRHAIHPRARDRTRRPIQHRR
jgi:hypothetical protein